MQHSTKNWPSRLFSGPLLVLLLALAAGFPAAAQDSGAGRADPHTIQRVGVLDLDFVLRNAQVTGKIRELLNGKREEFNQEFAVIEQELRNREKELQEKRSLLSNQAYNEELRKFQDRVASVQQDVQAKRQSLDRAFQDAQDKLRARAIEIITGLASERRLDLVLNRDTGPQQNRNVVLIFRQELNITEEVLKRLDAQTQNARLVINEDK